MNGREGKEGRECFICFVFSFIWGFCLFLVKLSILRETVRKVESAPPDGKVGPGACQRGCGSENKRNNGGRERAGAPWEGRKEAG